MEHKEDHISLKDAPTSTLLPPPRFDAAASAAARPVEPLPNSRIQIDFPLKPTFSRLINKRSKFLALMAIVGLATGAAGGILVVERDKQHRVENSASMIPIPTELTPAPESAAPTPETSEQNLGVSEPIENQVPVRRPQRRPRKPPKRELVVQSNADEEEEEEWDRDREDDDDEDKDDEDRKKDRERRRRDRERDADSRRRESTRQRAELYDTMRVRKP